MTDEVSSAEGSFSILSSLDHIANLQRIPSFGGNALEWLPSLSGVPVTDHSVEGEILRFYDEFLERKYICAVVEETEDLIAMFDLDLKLITANRAFVQAVRKNDLVEIVGKTHEEIFLPYLTMDKVREYSSDELRAQNLCKGCFVDRERKVFYPDGNERFFLARKFPIFNSDEHVIATATIARDITLLKLAKRDLMESENKYSLLFQNATDKIFLLKMGEGGAQFLEVNASACRSLGYSREEFLSMSLSDIDPAVDNINKIVKALRKKGSTIFEAVHVRKNGSKIDVEVNAHLCNIKGKSLILCISRDISGRKRRECRIQNYQRQLQELSYRMMSLKEKTKRGIAEQIHDNIGQDLLLSKLRLEMARKLVTDPKAGSHMDEVCRNLERSIAYVRHLTFELSPPVLYELGLPAAVEWFGDKVEKQSDIGVSCKWTNIPPEISDEISSFLFRAVRELLTNVVKHSEATEARVSASIIKGDLRVVVRDNGKGIHRLSDIEYSGKEFSFGLFSISEQARALGGSMRIGRNRGGGARISVTVPLNTEKKGS